MLFPRSVLIVLLLISFVFALGSLALFKNTGTDEGEFIRGEDVQCEYSVVETDGQIQVRAAQCIGNDLTFADYTFVIRVLYVQPDTLTCRQFVNDVTNETRSRCDNP